LVEINIGEFKIQLDALFTVYASEVNKQFGEKCNLLVIEF
jgi:hypothetical protein